jgi:methionine-rich copper-binding protein CopC
MGRAITSIKFGLILLLALSVACPSYVRAHAIVLASDPADGSTTRPPRRLMLHFNSRVEKSLCSVSLTGPEPHHRARLRQAPSSSDDVLVYALPDLAPGAYQVRWKVLAADGHLTEGAVRFVVDGR